MAKLLAFYSLCPINNIEDFLGLSRDVDPGCVINTLGRNIILVVKLSNQRQIRSWTVLDRLSSKVVYDFVSERYVAVFGGCYLRCWERDRTNLNTVKRIKLYRTVLELVTLTSGQTLVLYDDGTCESLESALITKNQDKLNPDTIVRKRNIDSKTHVIKDVQVFVLEDGTPLLTYFAKHQESGAMELNYALLNQSDLKVAKKFEKVKLERIGDDIKLVGCCVADGSTGPSLITMWSDSRMFALQLHLGQSPKRHDGVGNFIDMLITVDVSQPLSLTSIGKDYIAVYAGNNNQDGATLSLFNVQVRVIQAKQYFKVYFRASRFWVIESNILLAFGQKLAVVPYKISKEQLSDMIGSQCTSLNLTHTIDDESLNEEADFLEAYTYGGSLKPLAEQKDKKEQQVDLSSEETAELRRFYSKRDLEELLREAYRHSSLPIDVIEDATLPKDMVQVKLFNNADTTLGPLVFHETFEIIAEEMERSGFSEQEICNKLIPWLLQADLPYDLAKCLKRYSVISERMLVKALVYAMNQPLKPLDELADSEEPSPRRPRKKVAEKVKPSAAAAAMGKANKSKVPAVKELTEPLPAQNVLEEAQFLHASHRVLLNIVLSCSYDRTAIIPYVRTELSFPLVQKLLEHLEDLLVDPEATLSETLHTVGDFDSDEKAVEWITVLLDAHYQQFVMSKDTSIREQLKRLMQIVERHIELLKELRNFAPTLEQLVESREDSQQRRYTLYSIETVQLY